MRKLGISLRGKCNDIGVLNRRVRSKVVSNNSQVLGYRAF